MGKTYKDQANYKRFKDVKKKRKENFDYFAQSEGDKPTDTKVQRKLNKMNCNSYSLGGLRHGNDRKAYAEMKVTDRRLTRRKLNRDVRKQINE